MKVLAFSDLHRDLGRAADLVEHSAEADLVIGAGDFASIHEGLEETIDALAAITTPTVLVPGNNETEAALREAAAGWYAASVLHGGSAEIDGVTFFGLGAGIPVTPWDWSFDLDEDEAAEALGDLDGAGAARRPLAAQRALRRRRLGRPPRLDRDRRGDRGPRPATRRLRPHPRELGRAIADRRHRDRELRAGRGVFELWRAPAGGSVAGTNPNHPASPDGRGLRATRRERPRAATDVRGVAADH